MNKTFAILLASTVLAAGAGVPAWSAMHHEEQSSIGSDEDGLVKLTSDDDEGYRGHGPSLRRGDDHHHHGRGDDDDDDDHDDEDHLGAAWASPAPAGTVAAPANGVFGSGAMPKAKVN